MTLTFDLEDCTHILFTVFDFARKGLHVQVRINVQYLKETDIENVKIIL